MLPGGSVGIKVTGAGSTRSAGFSGLATCGSVWACPVCSDKIARHRQHELADVIRAWQGAGNSIALVTLTMRHRKGQRLKTLWDGLSGAWHAATSGYGWKADEKTHQIAGYCRVVEVTLGKSGWHVHVHALVFLRGDDSILGAGHDAAGLGASMFQRWRSHLKGKGFLAPIASRGGLDVKLLDGDATVLGNYFTKNTYTPEQAAMEITRGDLKDGRRGNRSPFQLLRDLVKLGQADDLDAWHEWERASHGRRQMTWSRRRDDSGAWISFRDAILGDAEKDDQTIVEEDHGGDLLVLLPAATWQDLARHSFAVIPRLLEVAESDDDGLRLLAFLHEHGIPHEIPRPAD